MKIAVDKNQLQKGSHAQSNAYNHRMMERAGHELIALPCPFGDYCEVTDEMQETIDRRGDKLKKADLVGDIKIAVDRKNSIDEICGNVCSTTSAHERFRDEVILAQKCGCKFYVLIEDESVTSLDDLERWENPREKKYFYYKALMAQGKKLRMILPKQPPASGKKLAKALRTMEEKYGVEFVFAKPKDAAERIVELLTRGE
jgi:ribosome-associated protein